MKLNLDWSDLWSQVKFRRQFGSSCLFKKLTESRGLSNTSLGLICWHPALRGRATNLVALSQKFHLQEHSFEKFSLAIWATIGAKAALDS